MRRLSVVLSAGKFGNEVMFFCTKCLTWRYLKKCDFGRSNFSESCVNDPNLPWIKRLRVEVMPFVNLILKAESKVEGGKL